MSCRVICLSLLSLALSACSSSADKSKQALGDFGYAKKAESKSLIVPENLDKPDTKNRFFISNAINHAGPIGRNVDVRAPSLVLPIAASSREVVDTDSAIIWFDKVIEEKDLLSFVESALVSKLTSDGVGYTIIKEQEEKIEPQSKKPSRISIYESDWFNQKVESDWLSSVATSATSLKYRYELYAKPHGRSVSVKVTLLDYKKTDELGTSKKSDPIDTLRAEIAMLNQITSEVDFLYRKKHSELRKTLATQQLVSIGENAATEKAYIVEMNLDDLWSNMPIFFEKHGFSVTDLNESDFIYYVDFVKPDTSIWDKIWGDEVPVIDINDTNYQFVLATIEGEENKTSVTIYNSAGEPLRLAVLEQIFPVMEAGLSFRNVY